MAEPEGKAMTPERQTADAPLLWTPRETAKALSICGKTLWSLTRAGRLPCVRIGRAVRYSRDDILRFIEASKDKKEATNEH